MARLASNNAVMLRCMQLLVFAFFSFLGSSESLAQTMWWRINSNVYRRSIEGAQKPAISINGFPTPFAISNGHSRAYWHWPSQEMVYSIGLDDDRLSAKELVEVGEINITTMAIDVARRDLYWAESVPAVDNSGSIQRFHLLNSSQVEDVLTGRDYARGLLIDSQAGHLYWIESGNLDFRDASIFRANLDGTGVAPWETGIDGAVGLGLDATNSKLYWFDENHVYRRNKDGTGTIELIIMNAHARGIGVDAEHSKIYWADAGRIHRADLIDGSNPEVLLELGNGVDEFGVLFGDVEPPPLHCQTALDTDFDRDIDLADFARWQNCHTGPAE